MSALFVEVAVVLPVIGTYYYRVPPELAEEVAVGRQILVPFGRRRLTGYILNISSQPPVGMEITIRDILQVSSTESYFTESTLPFYRWLSNYYLAPLGDVIQGVLPRGASTSTRRAAFVSKGGRAALNRSKATLEETAILSL
ncbi:MAG: hypothetical protein PVH57_06415, partial [Syntrophobacterales bacterium]